MRVMCDTNGSDLVCAIQMLDLDTDEAWTECGIKFEAQRVAFGEPMCENCRKKLGLPALPVEE